MELKYHADEKQIFMPCAVILWSPFNRYYSIYCAVLKKVIKEAKQSYYNNLIEIARYKIRTLWNIIRNDTNKIQTTEKISEMNLVTGNIENAKDMACVFNKLFY